MDVLDLAFPLACTSTEFLFLLLLRCSRWYWSTVNPLRRCKYTFRVTEVRPPVQEKPVEESPDQGENCTIAHSPCPQSGEYCIMLLPAK